MKKTLLGIIFICFFLLAACASSENQPIVQPRATNPMVEEQTSEPPIVSTVSNESQFTTNTTEGTVAITESQRIGVETMEIAVESSEPSVEEEKALVEVSEYFAHCKVLVQTLDMQQGETMWYCDDETYKKGGFLLNYYIEDGDLLFLMQNNDSGQVTLYGNVIGDTAEAFVSAMQQHRWIMAVDENNEPFNQSIYFLGTIIDGVRFCAELSLDRNGTVTSWFLSNWPQGDYEDFYAQFEDG